MAQKAATSNGAALTLAALAKAKALPVEFLRLLGLHELPGGVGIPYYGPTGEDGPIKRRTALTAKEGSFWPKGVAVQTYGDWRLGDAAKAGFLILVEGESDCWALWRHQLPALGIPGANNAKVLTAEQLSGPCCFAGMVFGVHYRRRETEARRRRASRPLFDLRVEQQRRCRKRC